MRSIVAAANVAGRPRNAITSDWSSVIMAEMTTATLIPAAAGRAAADARGLVAEASGVLLASSTSCPAKFVMYDFGTGAGELDNLLRTAALA
jgi:hypothetical protein